MALYWHPFLAEMLRLSYADRLDVRENLPLGDLPLEADLLLIRRDPAAPLPYPLDFLGPTTLVEFKSPTDTADQAALEQLEIYGLRYVRREGLARRDDLTLWLMASQVAENVSRPGKAELTGARAVGPGVTRGTLDGFPTCVVDLQAVPFTPETLPLHMVATGKQERALAEFVVGHYRHYPRQLDVLTHLHEIPFMEVLMSQGMTLEQIDAHEKEVLKKWLAYSASSRRDFIASCDPKDLLAEVLRTLGKDEVKRLIEAEYTPPAAAEPSPPKEPKE